MTKLEDTSCLKIEHLMGQEKHNRERNSLSLPSHRFLKPCTCRKSKIIFDWIQNELSDEANNFFSNFGGLFFVDLSES